MAGTLFEATNLPLKCWCLGLYLVAQNKDGLSTLNLGRPLGIAQNSAWLMTHTFMHAMLEAENCQPLGERVELDEAYWGGERRGGKRGRGVPGKYPFLAAVDTTEEGRPLRIKCSALDGFRKKTLARWAAKLLRNDGHVVSDGLSAFKGIDDAGI